MGSDSLNFAEPVPFRVYKSEKLYHKLSRRVYPRSVIDGQNGLRKRIESFDQPAKVRDTTDDASIIPVMSL
jgi:hypothetical protein